MGPGLLVALGCAAVSAPPSMRTATRIGAPRASPRLASTVQTKNSAPVEGGAYDTSGFDSVVMKTYSRVPIAIDRGEGCVLWDTSGKRYLDFAAGIATACLGHAHPALVDAVTEQARAATRARTPSIGAARPALPRTRASAARHHAREQRWRDARGSRRERGARPARACRPPAAPSAC